MRPWVGLRNLVRRLKQVVLPAPFGPINAWIVPRSTWRFTPLTATKPANSLVRSSVARIVWLPIRRDNSPCPGPIYGGNGRIVQYRDREIGAGIAQQLAGATKFGCRPARGLRPHQRLGGGTGFAQKRRQLVGGGRCRRPRRQRNLDDARQFRRLLTRAQRRQEIYQSAEAAFVPFAADAGVTGVDERRLVTRLLAFDRMADRLHVAHALFTQDLLHAPDRIALAVEQMPNAAQEIDVVVAIVAPAAAAFQRLDLSEAGFPEAQDVLRQVEVIGDLTDGTERVWSFFHVRSRPPAPAQRFLPWPTPLIRLFMMFDGLNTMTRRGSIGTSSPVFGLRPTRRPLLRTMNEPNEESFTFSPRARQSEISCKTNSTSAADSVRESPTF